MAFDHPDHGRVWVSVQQDVTSREGGPDAFESRQRRRPGRLGLGALSGPWHDRPATGLEVCLVCRRDFVSMVRCTKAGDEAGGCFCAAAAAARGMRRSRETTTSAALERAIAQSLETVAEELNCLDLERMGCQVEAFSQALELDLIDADDF